MNKILALFQEEEVQALLERELAKSHPEIKRIFGLEIMPFKKNVWETTYHVVIAYHFSYATDEGRDGRMMVICSAHSEEPRDKAYAVLQYLWNSDLNKAEYGVALPEPLFYSSEYRGFFYRAVEGKDLLYFIKKDDRPSVEDYLRRTAVLFSLLHALPIPADTGIFSMDNRRLETVVPGRTRAIAEIRKRYPKESYADDLDAFYTRCEAEEDSFFSSTEKRWLIHGDAHPENIIAAGDRIGLIDFTDFCPADFARDLGAFMQQVEYKIIRNLGDEGYGKRMKHLFLESYLQASGLVFDDVLQRRLDTYFYFTASRSACFWLLKYNSEPQKAAAAIERLKARLAAGMHAQD
ncbi:MAG: phosphotransferase family protein [Bacillota bacterium]